jgi:hypothetical protein
VNITAKTCSLWPAKRTVAVYIGRVSSDTTIDEVKKHISQNIRVSFNYVEKVIGKSYLAPLK